MDADILAWMVTFITVTQSIEIYVLYHAVKSIRMRMDAVLPEDTKAGDILAQGVISLMRRIQENPEDAKVVGGFVRGCAIAAWDEVSTKIPGIGPATQTNEALEKLAAKNPWVGMGLGLMQTFGPMVAQQIQGAKPGESKRGGTGGRQYG